MRPTIPLLLTAAISFSSAVSAELSESIDSKTYSTSMIGFEVLNYSESIGIVGGQLDTDTTLTNPMYKTVAHIPLENSNFGLYIQAASTFFHQVDNEYWNVGSFGAVQSNTMKVSSNNLEMLGAYNFNRSSQMTTGFAFHTLDFTRSDWKSVTPGGPNYTAATNVAVGSASAGAINEEQNTLELIIGYKFNRNFGKNQQFNWHIGSDITLPLWYRVINTAYPNTEFTDIVNGWGLNLHTGLDWAIKDNFSANLALDTIYKRKDAVYHRYSNGGFDAVPDVQIVAVQFTAGITWFY